MVHETPEELPETGDLSTFEWDFLNPDFPDQFFSDIDWLSSHAAGSNAVLPGFNTSITPQGTTNTPNSLEPPRRQDRLAPTTGSSPNGKYVLTHSEPGIGASNAGNGQTPATNEVDEGDYDRLFPDPSGQLATISTAAAELSWVGQTFGGSALHMRDPQESISPDDGDWDNWLPNIDFLQSQNCLSGLSHQPLALANDNSLWVQAPERVNGPETIPINASKVKSGMATSAAVILPSCERVNSLASASHGPALQQGTKRKRGRLGSEDREQIKQLRRQGACLRCRIYKEKCDFGMPCAKCLEVLATAKVFRQPCQRLSLKEVITFRAGNSRAGQLRSAFPRLSWSMDDPRIRTVQICQDFKNPNNRTIPTIPLACRRFIPRATDALSEPYEAVDGDVLIITSPPYACFDADSTRVRSAFETYLDQCQLLAEEDLLTEAFDDIQRLGLLEARRYVACHEHSIVASALRILACVHMAGKQPIMVGDDLLDVDRVNNEKFDIHGKAPVPSVLDYQLDTVMIHFMHAQIKELVKGLKQLIFGKNNTGNWYEIFLTTFVLLSALEQVYVLQIKYIRRNAGRDENIFMSVNYVSRCMIDEWRASAKNLIYHFRCVLKAMIPFSSAWTPEKQKQAKLDKESMIYIHSMAQIVVSQKATLTKLREEGLDNVRGQPLVWLVELFLDD